MTTPAISTPVNPANALASGSTPGTKASAASSDMQFSQMLSRGIEERSAPAATPPKAEPAKPATNTPARQATRASQSPAKETGSPSSANETASAEQDATAPAAESAPAPVEHDKTGSGIAEESDVDEAALAASSDELLALVANLIHPATPNASTGPTADTSATTDARTAADSATPAAIVGADAQVAAADSAAAAAAVSAALGANMAPLAPGAGLPGVGTTATVAKGETTAQAVLTELRNSTDSEAASAEEPDTVAEFGASLAQARDRKEASDARADLAQSRISGNERAAAAQSSPEFRAAEAEGGTEPAAPVAPINIAPQSQVSLQQAQAVQVQAASDKLAPRVGSAGWDQAVAQKVVWMVAGELQSATLTLNPPDLGPLEVVLSVSNNQADVNFTAAQPEVRQALENAVPKLKEMLGDAGIQLGQANVSAGTPNNRQGESGDRREASRGADQTNNEGAEAVVRTVRSQGITGSGQGLVDTFA